MLKLLEVLKRWLEMKARLNKKIPTQQEEIAIQLKFKVSQTLIKLTSVNIFDYLCSDVLPLFLLVM